MEGLELTLLLVRVTAFAFGAGMALWRLSMLLGWKKLRVNVVGYSRQPPTRRGQAMCLTVRVPTDDGDPVEAKDDGVWNRVYVPGLPTPPP